jgi:superfamily II DNA helicase RecQ
MALNDKFHKTVLRSKGLQENAIGLIIDEGHSISEWGVDDFRPKYSDLGSLRARLPPGLPILIASATTPPLVKNDIVNKLGIINDYQNIDVSNQKMNVALSLRVLQHPQGTHADLLTIFTSTINKLEDFPQTIIYVNSRPEAEQIESFLRENAPSYMPQKKIEFYHRMIDEERKRLIEAQIMSGELCIIIATDALGMAGLFSLSAT